MINSIIEAISVALNEAFGDEYEIHMEEIKQDLKEPCFFIQCLNPSMEQFLGKRYFRQNLFCIQYFPKTDEVNRECHEVAEAMYFCLEYITCQGDDKPIRGTKMHHEVVNRVLNFFVNYDGFVYKAEDSTPMGELGIDTQVK